MTSNATARAMNDVTLAKRVAQPRLSGARRPTLLAPAARSRPAVDPVPQARVLILDEQSLFANSLSHSFEQLGYSVYCEPSLAHAFEASLGAHTEIIVAELKVSGSHVLERLAEVRLVSPRARVVIATAQPSIATAIRAVRLGVDAYLAKPVSASLVLQNLEHFESPSLDPLPWPSLDRTIWEYLNHVVAAAGSLSEAARRIGVDRRSLRRMLAKYPPPR
jgi:two-component system response regulator RegA